MNSGIDQADITGLILAGGRGVRMGEKDKGLLPFHERPLFMHAALRLIPQVKTILVNANQNQDEYQKAGFTVISDHPLDFSGPLAGFAAGLAHCKTPYLLAVPCDSPFFPDNLALALGKALVRENADIAFAATGENPPYLAQPVFCLMRQNIKPHLDAFLAGGQRKIKAWYALLKTVMVCFPNEADFYNINTLTELAELEKTTKISK